MKLLQTTQNGLKALDGMRYLIVESQEYGQPSDFRYNVAVSEPTSKKLLLLDDFRLIKDTGRTVGFWQRLGGKGIYKVDLVKLQKFSPNVERILLNCKEATINFSGKTWNAIIKSMPFMPDALAGIGIKPSKSKS